MSKRLDFYERKESRMDDKINKTLNAEFEIPKVVDLAKQEAFAKIREKAAASNPETARKRRPKRKSRMKVFYEAIAGTAVVAAGFSMICIANPAFAAEIPVVGSVFERIGKSLGFSGDYSEYAAPLVENGTEIAENTADVQEGGDSVEMISKKDSLTDTAYKKNVDGTTVTLSEVYCNEEALYISMLVESEEPLPETFLDQSGKPIILADAELKPEFNPGFQLENAYLDGKILDEKTYAGVLRVDMRELTVNEAGWSEYYEKRNAFLKEKGFDVESPDFSREDMEAMEAAFGMETFSDAGLVEFGGPDISEYDKPLEVPETFNMDFNIHNLVGYRPDELSTKPEMPQELIDEYNQAMADAGLDISNYENFTEEQKETEKRLHGEQMSKYLAMYPDVNQVYNPYEHWLLKGDWEFSLEVEMNHTDTVTKEVNLVDEEGSGIISVTKTPFELTVQLNDPNANYAAAVLDADGDMMPRGGLGSANTYAVQDRNTSKVYVYLCDYEEYMCELKGYYWSLDYQEKKKTKNFKQYLDERGIPFAEVSFEDEK